MSDNWMIRATTFANCNCELNCGCQFNLPTTHGFCHFLMGGVIDDGYFNDVSLDGLKYVLIFLFPGEIAEGNGKALVVIDKDASEAQREAMEKIVTGEASDAGATHFSVFRSVCSEFLATQFETIDLDIDIEERTARLNVAGLVDATGQPAINVFNGDPYHIALARPSGSFEYTYAELGRASATVSAPVEMQLNESYAQYCVIHFDQDGLVKSA